MSVLSNTAMAGAMALACDISSAEPLYAELLKLFDGRPLADSGQQGGHKTEPKTMKRLHQDTLDVLETRSKLSKLFKYH